MKKLYISLFSFLFSSLNILSAQTTYTSAASGDWNDSATWSPIGVPASNSPVIILGHTIMVTANALCASVTAKGVAGGASTLSINSGSKLTVAGTFVVEPTNDYNNDTYINGTGSLQVATLQVGFSTIQNTWPQATRGTTLYIDETSEFKITGNIISTTPVNTNPIAYNESRIRHRSGVIDVSGILSIPAVSSGPTLLGYRTDNLNQGDSKIIFRNASPITNLSGQISPNFQGGSVEYASTASAQYALPPYIYKNLILNSPRIFLNSSGVTKISEGGKLYLLNGTLKANTAASSLGLDNNVEIVKTGGVIFNDNNSRPRLTHSSNKYSVTYNQHTSNISSGRELLAINGTTEMVNALKAITINTTNGVTINETPSSVNNNATQTEDLIINASCTLSGNGKIKVTNLLDVPNGSTVTVDDLLINLISDNSNTARVASLPSNTIINGKVVVERYLENARRQWRLLTAPVIGSIGNTIYNNWQNEGNTDGVSGIEIWGPQGNWQEGTPGNGLVLVNNSSYNVRKFNNTSGTWSNVTDSVNETLFTETQNKGFLVFATHPFNSGTDGAGGYIADPLHTTLKPSGNLLIGNITYGNILPNQFYLIGNPYASPIDFGQILADPINSGIDKIWFIDPTVGLLGGYVTWQKGFGYSNGATSFNTNTVFQSGQAFFVRATTSSSSLTIKESHKSTSSSNTTINRTSSKRTNTTPDLLRILLEKENDNMFTNMDGVVAAFYADGSNNVNTNDAGKLSNPSETLALFNSNSSLSIEHRAPIQDNDFLSLRLSGDFLGTSYKLKLYTENFTYNGYAYLEDTYLGTKTQIALNGSVFEYTFKVTSEVLSTGNRFKVIFANSLLDIPEVSTTHFSVYPNPADAQDAIRVMFHSGAISDDYSYKIINVLGQVLNEGQFLTTNSAGSINLENKLTSGLYFIQLSSTRNNMQYTKKLIIK